MPDAPTEPRKRGAQPGNANASPFARTLSKLQLELFDTFRAGGSLEDDIALLRTEIARLVRESDYDPRALAALSRALTSALLASARLAGPEEKEPMMAALQNVLADVEQLRKQQEKTT